MDKKKCYTTLAVIGVTLLTVQGLLAWKSFSNVMADIFYWDFVDPLIYIEIQPRQARVEPGKKVTFNVEGVYTSSVIPIEADWFWATDEELERIPDCRLVSTCTVTAKDNPGLNIVQASVKVDEELTDHARVRVVER